MWLKNIQKYNAISTHAKKKAPYRNVLSRLIEVACASTNPVPDILDVYINLRKERGTPLVEAKFTSVSGAQSFRCEGVNLAKAKHAEFASLYFLNSVT